MSQKVLFLVKKMLYFKKHLCFVHAICNSHSHFQVHQFNETRLFSLSGSKILLCSWINQKVEHWLQDYPPTPHLWFNKSGVLICISNKFPSDAKVADSEWTLKTAHLLAD